MKTKSYTSGKITALWAEELEDEQPTLTLINCQDSTALDGVTRTAIDIGRLPDIIHCLKGIQGELEAEPPADVKGYVEEREVMELGREESRITEVADAVSEQDELGNLCPACGKAYAMPRCPKCGWSENWRQE
jgi:hypothetical protein